MGMIERHNFSYRFRFIKLALKQRCKWHDNRSLSHLERYFYTLKVIICLLLNRRKNMCLSDSIDSVAVDNFRHSYSFDVVGGYDWEDLQVGFGIFKNWHYNIVSTSNY